MCNCSDLDDIIIFYKDGKYKVIRVAEKIFVGKNVLYLAVFKKSDSRTIYNAVYRDGKKGYYFMKRFNVKKSDSRTIYNAVYRDGKKGYYFMKRFNVTSLTRDKEYDLTQGTPGSRVMYFSANPNGE